MRATANFGAKTKSHAQAEVKARNLLGMRWMLIGLYVAFFAGARPALSLWGWPLPMQFANHIGIALTFLLMAIGTYQYLVTQKVNLLYRKSYVMKIGLK